MLGPRLSGSTPGASAPAEPRGALCFIFDPRRCVGCEACRMACGNAQSLPTSLDWRRVRHGNPEHHPDRPTFHLSMACNHCQDPACLQGCPASAYTKDPATGIVTLHRERCMGCTYCSWVCPFGAPRFEQAEGTMTKCTFCAQRQGEGLRPACVACCPTGALGMEETREVPQNAPFPGLFEGGPKPFLRVAPLHGAPEGLAPLEWAPEHAPLPPAIDLRHEWTLLLLTWGAALLVGLVGARALGASLHLPPLAFLGTGAALLGLSTLHLGRRSRAWRAYSGWRSSWLSREILLFPLFLGLTTLHLWAMPEHRAGATLCALLGLGLLHAMDRLYQAARHRPWWHPEGLHLLLTGAFLAAALARHPLLALPLALLRAWLFLRRRPAPWLALLRLGPGLALPLFLTHPLLIAALLLAGEMLDRVQFYLDLDLPSPEAGIRRWATSQAEKR